MQAENINSLQKDSVSNAWAQAEGHDAPAVGPYDTMQSHRPAANLASFDLRVCRSEQLLEYAGQRFQVNQRQPALTHSCVALRQQKLPHAAAAAEERGKIDEAYDSLQELLHAGKVRPHHSCLSMPGTRWPGAALAICETSYIVQQ